MTGNFRVALESWRALASESSGEIVTDGAASANGSGFDAGRRRCALVDVDARDFGVAAETGRAGARVSAVRVRAEASGAASVAELALVDIGALCKFTRENDYSYYFILRCAQLKKYILMDF